MRLIRNCNAFRGFGSAAESPLEWWNRGTWMCPPHGHAAASLVQENDVDFTEVWLDRSGYGLLQDEPLRTRDLIGGCLAWTLRKARSPRARSDCLEEAGRHRTKPMPGPDRIRSRATTVPDRA